MDMRLFHHTKAVGVAGFASLVIASACSSPAPGSRLIGSESPTGSGGTSSTGGSGSGSGATGSGGVNSGVGGGFNLGGDLSNPAGGSAGLGNGVPEVCDGLDNDANGQIDDLDAGHDGVCDCLSLATIGHIGPWSNGGNIFVDWLNARSPQGATALEDQVLTPELLAPFQIVVALHVATSEVAGNSGTTTPAHHAFTPEEAAAFKGWVEAGGGAMTTIGYMGDEVAEVANINLLLSTVGMGYSATAQDLSGYIDTWMAHPVTAGVSNIFTDNGTTPDGPMGMTVASGNGMRNAMQVTQAAMGRVVVWGDEWITYDSEWADVQDQQVELLWLNILKWLSPPNVCQVDIPVVQ